MEISERIDNPIEQETNMQEVAGFVIDTPSKADWAIEKIKQERSRRDLFLETAERKIEQLKNQMQKIAENCDSNTSFFLFALNDYLDKVPAKETKTQRSLELPSGKIVRTLAKNDFTYEEEQLLLYLKENAADYVKTVEKSQWGEFKKDLQIQGELVVRKSTGEVVECIKVIEKPSVCEVK